MAAGKSVPAATPSWQAVVNRHEPVPWPPPTSQGAQFNVGLQRVAQPRRKDVDLVFLSQPVAAGEEGEKFPLILRHRAFTP
jgi:hypothetical protein